MKAWLARLGQRFIEAMRYIGGLSTLLGHTLVWIPVPPLRPRRIVVQMDQIGVNSFLIVFLTSMFTGMVLALQSAYQMQKIQGELYIPSLVALSMMRELGPVLTALVVAGRVGASITAELGTMKVTEQLDALLTMATNPVRYLVVPRFIATVVMLPILTLYADCVGIFGGYLIGISKLHMGSGLYMKMTWSPLIMKDLWTGLIKAVFFAMIICTVACFEGMRASGGAEGVGRATTFSVVTSFILIIAADCFFTALFYFAFR